MGMQLAQQFSGVPGITFNITVSDVSQAIPTAKLTRNTAKAVGAIISSRDQDVVFAFGVAPDQSGLGHLLSSDGDFLVLDSYAAVRDFRVINETVSANGKLTITIFF